MEVLAQELIPGPETCIESYHVYVDGEGEVVGQFTGKKIRTYPERFGMAALGDGLRGEASSGLGRPVALRARSAVALSPLASLGLHEKELVLLSKADAESRRLATQANEFPLNPLNRLTGSERPVAKEPFNGRTNPCINDHQRVADAR